MEKFTIVTQGSATYLERTLGADELLDEVDRGMLVSNQISGMLPLNIQWINADCRLLYNITGLTPLVQAARILEHETRLSNFFMALCRAEKECDEYLLDPHKIDLTPEHIYLDAAGHAYVMYVPVQAAPDKYTPTELAGYVLRMVGRQMPHDSRVVGVLSRQLLYGEKFSFVDLEKQIEEIPTQAEPSKVAYELKPPVSEPPVRQSEAGSASLRPEPVMYKPEPTPAHVPAEQPVQDSPFAAQQGGNPFIASQPEPQPKKEQKDERAEKAEKKSEKEKKSGGLFGGLFGGKKDKKKHSAEEQDNPFRQEAPAPEQSADKPAPTAASAAGRRPYCGTCSRQWRNCPHDANGGWQLRRGRRVVFGTEGDEPVYPCHPYQFPHWPCRGRSGLHGAHPELLSGQRPCLHPNRERQLLYCG